MGELGLTGEVDVRVRAVGAGELAWAAVVPCAVAAVAAIVLLGPPLGHALFPAPSAADGLWPPGWWVTTGHAEPVKQARYVLAVLAPLLLAAAVLLGARRGVRLRPSIVQVLTWGGYALLLAAVAVALFGKRPLVLTGQYTPRIFGPVAVAVAAVGLAGALLALRSEAVAARVARLVRETRTRRLAAVAFAVCFVAVWLLKTVMTDRLAGDIVGFNFDFTMNDALAVLNGRTPLVDYHGIYSKLFPYVSSAAMSAFGTTILAYTIVMAVLNCFALLAVYAVFRRVTRSSLLALGLFLPFVATSDVNCVRVAAGEVSPLALSAMWPMRFGGVYLLVWLTARHLDARAPRRVGPIFFVVGLVAINTLEFGAAAAVATLVALLCARPPRSRAELLRLAGEVAAGLLAALALVAVITLVRSGSLPQPSLLFEWPRIFTRLGWFSLPLQLWEFHLAIYATFAAATLLAAVRFARGDEDRLLTALLAWSGVFGLLAGSYFIGRPDALKLGAMLSPWSFALALLTVASVRALAAGGWRRLTLPHVVVLFAFALSVCSLARFSPPQTQIHRLTRSGPAPTYLSSAEDFIGERTHRGETVMILIPMGARMAVDLGLRNVAPYAFMDSVITRAQMDTVLDTIRREHVRQVFTPASGARLMQEGDAGEQQLQLLLDMGFRSTLSDQAILAFRRA